MNLRQLRFFVAVAETRNFHRAAERLNISQPPLTVAIRKLEEELGVRLFDRSRRGVELTAGGAAAVGAARETLAKAAEVAEAARLGASGQRGRLRVGFVGSAVSEILPRSIPEFRERFPHAELELVEMTSTDIAEAIMAKDLDVGLLRLPVLQQGLELRVIEEDVLVAALPVGLLPPPLRAIPLATLASHPFIIHSSVSILHSISLLACQSAGFAPKIAQQAVEVQTILSLVRSGLGVALVPARMARVLPAGVELRALQAPVPIATGVAWREDATPLAHNFVSIADHH
ncbi:LysR family transcriptional regulator [Sphingopyxis sp. 550A]